jgi:hypothetical protein
MENENMEMVNVDTTAEVENESSTGKNIAIIGLGAALLGAAAYGAYKLGAVVKNKIQNARRLKKAVKDAEAERKAAETADVTIEN